MNDKSKFKLFIEIFIAFFKIGCFTFGGGYAMIPLIEREVINNKNWVSKEEIIDVFAVSQSVPGAIAINSSTFIGYKIAGRLGAIVATLGVVIPSFIIITIIAAFFSKFQDNPIVKAAFMGIQPAVVALILMAAVKIGKTAVKDKLTIAIAVGAVILILFVDLHAIFVIIGGALVGIIIYFTSPKRINEAIEEAGEKVDIS